MGCNCGKPKCDGKCGISPAVLEINNNGCIMFHKVSIPASMGTSTENPPKVGAYKNVILYYEADSEAYIYSSDGIPTKITGVSTDYNILQNKPSINNVVLVGNKTLTDLGITGAINDAVSAEAALRYAADQALEQEIDDLRNNPDVVDIVGTYAELQAYDTSSLGDNDIVKVLQDETHGGASTYYKWHKNTSTWEYIGEQGPYYTKSQTDTLLSAKADISSLAPVATSGSYNDLTNKPTIGNATLTVQKNSATVGTFTANSTTDTTIDIAVPTKTSDLTNDGADGTSTYIELDDLDSHALEGTGDTITFNGTTDCTSLETELRGDATQRTLSGKNLSNIYVIPNQTGASLKINVADEKITISDNANIAGYTNTTTKLSVLCPTLQVGDTVYLFFNTTSSMAQKDNIYIQGTGANIYWGRGTSKTITQAMLDSTVILYGGHDETAVISNFMITKTNDATYEKFVGGIPSPNPDFPQAIKTVSGVQTVKITGKNLCSNTVLQDANNIRFYIAGITSNTITLSSVINVATASNSIYLRVDGTDKGRIGSISGSAGVRQTATLTLTDEQAEAIRAGSESYLLLYKSNAGFTLPTESMIELGNQATTYEPYQAQSQEINLGKNLLTSGVYGNANTIELNIHSGEMIPQTFTASFISDTAVSGAAALLYLNGSNTGTISSGLGILANTKTAITLTIPDSIYSAAKASDTIQVRFYKTGAGFDTSHTLGEPMIEAGSQATSYAPYKTPIELAKIGTYQDYIWNDDGTWKIHEEVGKTDLSNLYWYGSALRTTTSINNIKYVPNNQTLGSGIAEKYIMHIGSGMSGASALNCIAIDVSQVSVNTGSSAINPTGLFYYALATPTDTVITDTELVAQLDALKDATGYDGVTNIFSISPTLDADLRVTAFSESIIPVATTERAGIVKIGDNIDVDSCGVISAVDTTYTAGTGIDITGTTISGMTASVSGTTLILTNA